MWAVEVMRGFGPGDVRALFLGTRLANWAGSQSVKSAQFSSVTARVTSRDSERVRLSCA